MKVLYVSKALIVAAYRDKLRALSAHGRVSAVIPHRWGSQPIEPIEADGLRIDTCIALFHGRNHLHVYWRLGRVLDRIRPDIVHIDEEPYSAAAFQVTVLCSRRGLPCLVFAWQNLDRRLPPPFPAMRSTVFRRVAGAIAGTQNAADVLSRAGYDKPLAVIPQFGVDPARFHPDAEVRACRRARLGVAEVDFLIGFAGRLVKEKGVHLLLSALENLPGARLVILGDGPERERLARTAENPAIRGRVNFAGSVSSLEMSTWLPAFDVVVLPSLSGTSWTEQFGRILVEAMACGVPVIGSDSGEIPRVIDNAGLVVPEGNRPALVTALRDLAAAPRLRAELAEVGLARVRDRYTQDRVAALTADFYRALLSTRTGCSEVGT